MVNAKINRSFQQGNSTTYINAIKPSRLLGIYNDELMELSCTGLQTGVWPARRDPPDMIFGSQKGAYQ